MTDTALLVVDAQESFRHRPYWTGADATLFLDRLQTLIDGCAAHGVPIVQVFHVEDEGAFSLASGWVTTMDPLRIAPALTVFKHAHSALVGTPLAGWLTANGIHRLIVSGIRTEQCCETTTRHASDSGYVVDYVTEATLTFPMRHPLTGREVSPAEIKDRTELVLADRFARITTVANILEHLEARLEPV